MKWKSTLGSRRGRQWLVVALLVAIFAAGMSLTILKKMRGAAQTLVLQVDDKLIYANEAMVYWKLMQEEFERLGSEQVWQLDMLEVNPEQTAMDRVLESIVRVKVIQSLAGALSDDEKAEVQEKAAALYEQLGPEYRKQHDIDRELIGKIVEENYKAYRFEKDAKFLAGSNEEEIEQKMHESFAMYDHLDQELYLQTAMLQPMMFYTGQWADGKWMTYSEAQKQLIYEKVQRIRRELTDTNFRSIAEQMGDSNKIEDNPAFAHGAIAHKQSRFGYVYRGQMKAEVAEAVFAMEPGEMTDILETDYGYLLVRVITYRPPSQKDYEEYAEQLRSAKETFRAQSIEQLRSQRLEEEWKRLEEESSVQRFAEALAQYIRGNA